MNAFDISQMSPELFRGEHCEWLYAKIEQLCQGTPGWGMSPEDLMARADQRLEGAELERFRLSIQLILNVYKR